MVSRISPLPGAISPMGLLFDGEKKVHLAIDRALRGEERLREAAKHGFRLAVVPKANAPRRPPEGIEVVAVTRLQEALDAL